MKKALSEQARAKEAAFWGKIKKGAARRRRGIL
jgi:hypothetical protein